MGGSLAQEDSEWLWEKGGGRWGLEKVDMGCLGWGAVGSLALASPAPQTKQDSERVQGGGH